MNGIMLENKYLPWAQSAKAVEYVDCISAEG